MDAKFLINLKDDSILDRLNNEKVEIAALAEKEARFHIEALKKIKDEAQKNMADKWDEMEVRLKELNLLPEDYDGSRENPKHNLHLNDHKQLMLKFVKQERPEVPAFLKEMLEKAEASGVKIVQEDIEIH